MNSQKRENLLNLALEASPEERERSAKLDVGYEQEGKNWTLIVKYSGDLEEVRTIANRVTQLMNGYAIVEIREDRIEQLTEFWQVEYIEKPKRLFFEVVNGRRVSCIDQVQDTRFNLKGRDVLVAVIDSGIDIWSEDFQKADGTTRIRALWDQSLKPEQGETSPDGYGVGVEYDNTRINEVLRTNNPEEGRAIVRSRDFSGHGTAVAGVAAGSGSKAFSQYKGVAPESELLVVKLGTPTEGGFPRTTELMMGIDYVVKKALEYRIPVAINISFGNTYGSHEPYN